MLLLDHHDEAPVIRRTNPVSAEPETPSTAGEQRPPTLTCPESYPMLQKLRAGINEEHAPSNFYRKVLAGDIAEEFWMKKRLSDISNQILSLEIESEYDAVSQKYPNADRQMRTVLAFRGAIKDPAFLAALAARTRAARTFQASARTLTSYERRR